MDFAPKNQMSSIPDLRHRLRQLRWFGRAFRSNAEQVSTHFGVRFEIDERRLNQVFFDWLEALSAQRQTATLDRADYIVFAAGLALREFLRVSPVRAVSLGQAQADVDPVTSEIARFWPEGFLYTNFCVCAIVAVHEQEFGERLELEKAASDLRTWWTFRENANENPDVSIAFLDSFVGLEPNWTFPALARERAAIKRMLGADMAPALSN